MTEDILARARAALDGTTDGPWMLDRPHIGGTDMYRDGDDEYLCSDIARPSDAEFIATARTLVPELVAEVESLREWQAMHRGDLASLDALIAEAEDHHDAADTEAERLRAQIESVEQVADAYGHMPDSLSTGSDVADAITDALNHHQENQK